MARLTGYRAETCPHEVLYRHEVHRAYRLKNSRFSPLVEPDPPACLLDAVEAIAQGEGELDDYRRTNPRAPQGGALPDLPGPITSPDAFPKRSRR